MPKFYEPQVANCRIRILKLCLSTLLSCFIFSFCAAAQSQIQTLEKGSDPDLNPNQLPLEGENQVLVIQLDREVPQLLADIPHIFSRLGTDAVAQRISEDLSDPTKLEQWQKFAQSTQLHVLDVIVHPNEQKAVTWMNERFTEMGIPNLSLNAQVDNHAPDSTSLPEAEIKYKKWLRYLAGPGVAMAATLVNLPSQSSGALSDYMLLILPSVGVGVTTVLLEIQFAWPYLNNVFWKHVWKFGGRVMGRVTNIFVNFLYGMSLYGAGVGAAQLPVLFGGNPIAFTHLPFLDAVVAAAVGGLTFHLAMGQFQTDISLEEEHGAIRGSNRYGLETTGAVINNGARVLDWVVPAGLGTWAQMGFFALKTLPQMLKTNFATKIADRRVKEQLRSHQDKPKSWRSRCISAIQSLELINLPKLRK